MLNPKFHNNWEHNVVKHTFCKRDITGKIIYEVSSESVYMHIEREIGWSNMPRDTHVLVSVLEEVMKKEKENEKK